MSVTNTLAYYGIYKLQICNVFIAQAPRLSTIKLLFKPLYNKLVRLSLFLTQSHAHNGAELITTIKVLQSRIQGSISQRNSNVLTLFGKLDHLGKLDVISYGEKRCNLQKE